MNTWLKLIGTLKRPITGAPFYGNYSEEHIGFHKPDKPGIRTGEHLFLYAVGGCMRIFALAEAIGDPEPWKDGNLQWRIPVRYLLNLPVASGILLSDINSRERPKDITKSITQKSHIKLHPEESRLAYRKLLDNYAPNLFPDELLTRR